MNRQLVPYVGTARKFGTALGKYAWNNRRAIGNLASIYMGRNRRTRRRSTAQRMYKQQNGRRNVGAPIIRKGVCIHNDTINATAILDSRTLYVADLTILPQGTTEGDRRKDVINLSGIKILMSIRSSTTARTLYMNVAVVSPKDGRTVVPNKFFRGYAARGLTFGTGLSTIDFHHLPINTDLYNVLKHRRYKLCQLASGTAHGQLRPYFSVKWYIPIKRKLTYGNIEDNPERPDQAILLVQWLDRNDGEGGFPVETLQAVNQTRAICYFRDPN